MQAGADAYHQLSVIVNRAWPAPIIRPQEEERIEKQLRLLRMVPKLTPCAGKMEGVLTKMKSAIAHYKNAEADRRNTSELQAGRRENQEASRLLMEVASCLAEMRAFVPVRPPGMRQRPPLRMPNYSVQTEQQQQQQIPPTAPPIPNQLARNDDGSSVCPRKPLATTSWTLGYGPPNPDYVEPDIRKRFFDQYPELLPSQNKFDVFRAIPPDVLRIYPNLFAPNEINTDIRNLRAACYLDCPGMPEKVITQWQEFFIQASGKNVTRSEVVDFARIKVDNLNSSCFYPLKNNVNPLPTVFYKRSAMPRISAHIESVLNGQPQWHMLHYGGPGWRNNIKPGPLDRIPLCNTPNESRDEFPFASTYEGASAHVECVPVQEQNIQRILMSKFYRDEKLQAGDIFRVEVVP